LNFESGWIQLSVRVHQTSPVKLTAWFLKAGKHLMQISKMAWQGELDSNHFIFRVAKARSRTFWSRPFFRGLHFSGTITPAMYRFPAFATHARRVSGCNRFTLVWQLRLLLF